MGGQVLNLRWKRSIFDLFSFCQPPPQPLHSTHPPYKSEIRVPWFYFIFRYVYCSWIQHIFLWCHANIIWMESVIILMKTASILFKDVLVYFQSFVWIFIGTIVLSCFWMYSSIYSYFNQRFVLGSRKRMRDVQLHYLHVLLCFRCLKFNLSINLH